MQTNPTQVIIADDHPILLKGLQDFLKDLGLEVVGASQDGISALEKIRELQPPLAILDLDMPGMTGLEVAATCKAEDLNTKIILLTLHKELYLYHQAKELNLSGYILKDFALTDLSKAIDQVLNGESFFSEKIFEELEKYQKDQNNHSLTPSEKKILRLIAEGLATKEIADKLFISERTVDKHRSNMISKLNLEKKHNSLLIWAQKNKELIS
ncbi:response regulator [Algoriphagus algorifonticola]|uniref:response regulator n=1 Tax=Algoriphagus algorifonticola TaxID=2593007 RepID=UPI0011A1D8D6|nr:response regulator transcription factor [Algoriphagus algorifonticola]